MMREGSTPHSSTWSISAGLAQSNPHPGVFANARTTSQFGLHLTAAVQYQNTHGKRKRIMATDVCLVLSFETHMSYYTIVWRLEPSSERSSRTLNRLHRL